MQLCQNFGISGGGGVEYPKPPPGTPLCTSDVDSFRPKRTNYQPIFIVQSGSNRDENLQYIQRFSPYLTENTVVTITKTNQLMLQRVITTTARVIR